MSLPFTSHLAGYLLKRKFPGLPWFADHGDPFSVEGVIPQNNHRLYIRLNKWADRLIARKADCNFVNTPALKAHFSRLAGEGIRILEVPASPSQENARWVKRIASRDLLFGLFRRLFFPGDVPRRHFSVPGSVFSTGSCMARSNQGAFFRAGKPGSGIPG
ncbi:MAG: hypothetical protein IPH16_21060 [Haliscomenobacter sp.]|nr:hypothetical protein [Haliscomenobacter sp.]